MRLEIVRRALLSFGRIYFCLVWVSLSPPYICTHVLLDYNSYFLFYHSPTCVAYTHSGLELFLLDNTSYFLCFHSPRDRSRAYGTIQGLKPPRLALWSDPSPVEMLKNSGLSEKWRRREISNFGVCGGLCENEVLFVSGML